VVRVSRAEANDRLICPICWAAGDYTEVMEGRAKLERGTRIGGRLRVLVDKARFPKTPMPATDARVPVAPVAPGGEPADLAAVTQGDAKAAPERN
jgi:hypothetical protein